VIAQDLLLRMDEYFALKLKSRQKKAPTEVEAFFNLTQESNQTI